MEEGENRPIAAYVRISGEDQDLESQKFELRKFLAILGYKVEPLWFEDKISGVTSDRPGMESLKDWALKNNGGLIVALHSDRIARDPHILTTFLQFFLKAGVEFKTKDLNRTGNEFSDDLLEFMAGLIARQERSRILERTKRGKDSLLSTGSFSNGGQPPYGYKFIKLANIGNVTPRALEINPLEMDVVKEIYRVFVDEKMGIQEICRYLEDKKIPTPMKNHAVKDRHGKKRNLSLWDEYAVKYILSNTSYTGTCVLNKRYTIHVGQKEKRIRRQPNDPNLIKLSCPATIDQKTFDIAQELLANRSRKWGINSPNRRKYLLRGLMKCGVCGYRYSGTAGTTLKPGTGYYRCTSVQHEPIRGQKKRGCGNVSLRMEPTEWKVESALIKVLENPDNFINQVIKEMETGGGKDTKAMIVDLSKQMDTATEAKQRLVDGFSRGIIPEENYIAQLNKLKNEVSSIGARKTELEEKYKTYELISNRKQALSIMKKDGREAVIADSVNYLIPTKKGVVDFETNQNLLNKYIREIVVFPDRLEVVYTIPNAESSVVGLNIVKKSPSPEGPS